MSPQMLDGALDRPVPGEADVAAPGRHRHVRQRLRVHARAVHVELLAAEAVLGCAALFTDELGTEHVPVERVRARPVGHVDDAVVELDHGSSAATASTARAASSPWWRL